MASKKTVTKKISLSAAYLKQVRKIAAKTKLSEGKVVEKAIRAAQPLLKLIAQTKSTRKWLVCWQCDKLIYKER